MGKKDLKNQIYNLEIFGFFAILEGVFRHAEHSSAYRYNAVHAFSSDRLKKRGRGLLSSAHKDMFICSIVTAVPRSPL